MADEIQTLNLPGQVELSDELSLKPSQVYDHLKRSILDGSIPVGTHLTETEICQIYNFSRTPVHQAVVRLEMEHLVRTLPKRGLVVLEINPKDYIDLYDIAEVLEGAAARLAAYSCSPYQLHLLEHYATQEGINQANSAHTDLNYLFHITVAEASGNETLITYIKSVRERLSLVRFCKAFDHSGVPIQLNEEYDHFHIYEAIRNHEAEKAEQLMRGHISSYSKAFFNSLPVSQLK